jgi:hypothetical protein
VSADYLHLLQAAPVGRTFVIERREHDWAFDFGDGVGMAVSVPWRIVTAHGVALTDADDGQRFGLPAPVDAALKANELVRGRRVTSFDVELRTADIRVTLDGDVTLQLFNNSSGYEGWRATFTDDGRTITAVGTGGGDVNFFAESGPIVARHGLKKFRCVGSRCW